MKAYPLSKSAVVRVRTLPVAAMVMFLLVAGAVTAQARSVGDGFADLAEKLLPSVVNISSTQIVKERAAQEMPGFPPGSPFEEFFKNFNGRKAPQEGPHRATSLGSGFIISEDGYVVTNNHVIENADEITVILADDQRLKATLIGRDPKTDLALLKVKSDKSLKAVKFGDSDKSRVGDWVVAIGNPFGLGGTVTTGIVSARGRDIRSGPYDDFIQTDASINKGNSGGPMFNSDGEVIGVNSAIYSPSGGSVGIGFAIPSSTAQPIISQLREHGQIKRGWLGVQIQPVTNEIAESLGLKNTEGALVANVEKGTPADKAEIKTGDVILKFNGESVHEMRELPRLVANTAAGDTVNIEYWRRGKTGSLDVKIGELKDKTQMASAGGDGRGESPVDGTQHFDDLGLTLSSITDPMRERFNMGSEAKGVIVTGVDEDGPAIEKGVRPGDVIVEISQEEVSTPKQFAEKVEDAKKHKQLSVLLRLENQQGPRYVAIKMKTS